MKRTQLTVYKEKVLLVGVISPPRETVPPGGGINHLHRPPVHFPAGARRERKTEEDYLEELSLLTRTAGATVVEQVVQHKNYPDPAYYIGLGKAEEIAQLAKELDIDAIIFDNNLSPAQVSNLEKLCNTKVIDRTELILDIFATHARTKQAKLQIELAQQEYTLPRLKHLWSHLSRIEGGIGQRGPGEKQLEIDRRIARDRIVRLKRELTEINERRQREVATRSGNFTAALVGYTNAGKSTLMNTLTGSAVYVDDKLFSTLDTKTQVWTLLNRQKVLLSDTVGFIKNLPHYLVSSFHATLEEVTRADLLLHIVDAGQPADKVGLFIESVNRVLSELGCLDKPTLLIFNKIDRADPLELSILQKQYAGVIQISALKKSGLAELEKKVSEFLQERQLELNLVIPVENGKLLAYLAERGEILQQDYEDNLVKIKVRLGPRDAAKVLEHTTDPAKAGQIK